MTSHERAAYPRAFCQHGVRFSTVVGSNAKGDCPFCGRKDHFYVNVQTHRWDCKHCQKQGGFATFLNEIYVHARRAFTGKVAAELAEDRGLSVAALTKAGIGWCELSKQYVLPIWELSHDASRLLDLRYYRKGGKLMNTAGCDHGLYGWEHIDGQPHEVWLAEGEWDAIALQQAGAPGIVLGVPGAGIWKSTWASLLRDCVVHILYDNDPAGVDGMYKVYRALYGIAKSLDCIRWPQGLQVGWDIRDEFTKNGATGFLERVRKLLHKFPPGAETLEAVLTLPEARAVRPVASVRATEAVGTPQMLLNGEKRVSPEEVHNVFRKWLHIEDTDVLDIVFACAIANRLPGDPLWVFLVAPPGGMKTVPLLALEGAAYIVATTTVTPAALISGASFSGGADPSLLARFQGTLGKVLVIKDFTTILQSPQIQRDETFGILRDAYDGKIEKHFGNGVHRRYECHFGLLAAVTPIVEQYLEQNVGLGERFMAYRMPIPKDFAAQRNLLRKAQSNVGKEVKMHAELRECSKSVLAYDYCRKMHLPRVPQSIADKLVHAAQIVSIARGCVTRDRYSKEVTHVPFAELGTRLVKQLTKWSIGLAMFRGHSTVCPDDYATATRLAAGSCPYSALAAMRCMYSDTTKTWTTKDIAEVVGLPEFPTMERILENMALLGALQREKIQALRVKNVWRLHPDVQQALDVSNMLGTAV